MESRLRGDGDHSAVQNASLRNSLFTIHNSLLIILLVAFHSPLVTALWGAENVVRYEASHESMGTVFTVAVYGRDRAFLSEVVEEVFDEVDRLDRQMSYYKPES